MGPAVSRAAYALRRRVCIFRADRLDRVDAIGSTALMRAAVKAGGAGRVRSLLAAGASVDLQDKEGRTALMLAAETGRVETLHLLFFFEDVTW